MSTTPQITLPSQPRLVSEKNNSATFEIDNLYPGYGHTLGNSLRRIILSSLQGAAVTQIKIAGVDHEFSTIDGVKEDVVAIVLHIKKMRFKMLTDEPQIVTLKTKGAKKIIAGDFNAPGQIEILNKDEYIAEITSSKTELEIELTVEQGIGFVPKEMLQKDRVKIGVIVPDAVFAPIRRVNYEVENMRVGDRTDFNRLRLFIETDGSLTPKEALDESVLIMTQQLQSIIGIDSISTEDTGNEEQDTEEQTSKMDTNESLKILISELGISSRTESVLDDAGIRTVGGLVRKNPEDILALPGLGQKGLQEIKDSLANLGLKLKS